MKNNHTFITQNNRLHERIASAQNHLYNKLIQLDIKSANISEYNQRYLGSKIANLRGELQLYGRLLYLSLSNSGVSPEDFVLVDYGGGSGLISLLAVEMGLGTVIYNDIYDVSCADVRCLSQVLGLALNHIVCGDVDELILYLRKNQIFINAITSYDVLEHIYDVEYHFQKLGSLNKNKFRIVYASGANIANPFTVRALEKAQIQHEYKGSEKKWGQKERDTTQAYFDIRKKIISTYAPKLGNKQLEQLAHSTRGLIQRDIEKYVDEFCRQGSISYCPNHPTNTCDPYTGNWCEHLIEFEWLKKTLQKYGFSVYIIPSYYFTGGSPLKKGIKVLLNVSIQLLGKWGMPFAPYYVVYADSLPMLGYIPR